MKSVRFYGPTDQCENTGEELRNAVRVDGVVGCIALDDGFVYMHIVDEEVGGGFKDLEHPYWVRMCTQYEWDALCAAMDECRAYMLGRRDYEGNIIKAMPPAMLTAAIVWSYCGGDIWAVLRKRGIPKWLRVLVTAATSNWPIYWLVRRYLDRWADDALFTSPDRTGTASSNRDWWETTQVVTNWMQESGMGAGPFQRISRQLERMALEYTPFGSSCRVASDDEVKLVTEKLAAAAAKEHSAEDPVDGTLAEGDNPAKGFLREVKIFAGRKVRVKRVYHKDGNGDIAVAEE